MTALGAPADNPLHEENQDKDRTRFANAVRINQRKLASELADEFDYIVCGAGTSGSVVAARLAASNDQVRVLVLEAGGTDETDLVQDARRWPMTLGTELDWGFVAQPNPNLNGRSIRYSMGKVLGGGSSINVSTWSRGHRLDWDGFARDARESAWGYESVLNIYRRRIERWAGDPDPQFRGTEGVLHVQPASNMHPFSNAVLAAAEAAGLPRFPNPNGRMMEAAAGCAPIDETVRDGRRRSVYRAYLYPLMVQPNVTVLTDALVVRILFEGNRATGIAFFHDGKMHRVSATREVILSCGAIQTPKLLMLSGIGHAVELSNAGIPVVQSLPGVGRNLHDHVAFGYVLQNRGAQLPEAPRSQTSCFWTARAADNDGPNFYAYSRRGAHMTEELAARFNLPESSWCFMVGMRPQSRGSVSLTSADPSAPALIDANYLGDGEDLKSLVAGLEVLRDIAGSAALRPFTMQEVLPNTSSPSELERFFRDGLTTFWHQSGTAKMGHDSMSVVDGQLKVHGVERLRVVDASVLPRVTAGNTMAPCVVIGELGADFLLQEAAL